MSTFKVCDGLEIMNASDAAFKEMKRRNNTLEEGADFILEALVEFADCQLENHKYDSTISYKNLFFALKQIIDSASKDENTRNALLVGLVINKGFKVKEEEPKPEVKQEIKTRGVYVRNKAAIAKLAKKHTAEDIKEKFNFPSNKAAKMYMKRNGIEFVHKKSGRHRFNLEYKQVSELSKTMRMAELARAFACSYTQMKYFCKQNQIKCYKPTKELKNGR